MWKVTSPTNTAYLLGSVHLADKDMYPLPKVMEDDFAASKTLIVEVNLKDIDQAQLAQSIMASALYTDGSTLTSHLPPAVSQRLDAFCAHHNFDRANLEPMRPWMASVVVSLLPLQQKGQDPANGIDMHFMSEVKPPQRIEQLETADFQLKLLASGTEDEQVQSLDAALKESDTEDEKLQAAYFAGDADAILKLIEASTGPKSLMKKLLDDRNPHMADGVEDCLKRAEPCFVVVGAAHLLGDKGVVKVLEGRHYKVEPIAAQAP